MVVRRVKERSMYLKTIYANITFLISIILGGVAGSREEPSLALRQCMKRNGFRPRREHTIEGVASAAMRGLCLGRRRTHHLLKLLLCVFPQARGTPLRCPWQGDDVFRDKCSPCPQAPGLCPHLILPFCNSLEIGH